MGFFNTLGSWLCTLCGWLLIWFVVSCIMKGLKRTPMKKLNFIKKAANEGNTTIGKVSSYVVFGNPAVHEVEYAYSVGDKVYFATYQLRVSDENFNPNELFQPGDVIAMYIPNTMTMYYDAANPNKVVCKREVFSSRKCLKPIKTPKKNKFRDIYKDWDTPVVF